MTTNKPIIRLKTVGQTKVYEFTTHSKVVVENQLFENKIESVVEQTLLDQSPTGDLIGVKIVSTKQTAKDAASLLIADINEMNQYLVFETDLNGNALSIVNYLDLGNRWYSLKEKIRFKYGRTAPIEEVCVEFEKNLFKGKKPLLEAMQHKGLYGVLFSGIYAFNQSPVFDSKRVIKNLFGSLDLPLKMHHETRAASQETDTNFYSVGRGVLDETVFKTSEFCLMIRHIHDSFNLKVNLEVNYTEGYILHQSDGWIKEAQQKLKAEVKGVYLNETQHILTLKKQYNARQ